MAAGWSPNSREHALTGTAREPLLLLPGLLCDRPFWKKQLDGLYDVFACAVPQLDTQNTVAAMARDALALMEGVFSLAGHSMGGYVALEVMRQAPERVRRLALLSTQPRADTKEQAERRHAFIRQAERGGFLDVIADYPPLLFHEKRLSDEALVEDFHTMARRVGKEAFLCQQRAIMARPDSLATLKTISCPTLVLCGRQDLITPATNSELMADSIPGAQLAILEDCGHMTPVEEPAAVNDALRAWLGQCS